MRSTRRLAECADAVDAWTPAPVIDRQDNGDGSETVTARAPFPVADRASQFLRLRVSLRP